jgi:hypothetical protein
MPEVSGVKEGEYRDRLDSSLARNDEDRPYEGAAVHA